MHALNVLLVKCNLFIGPLRSYLWGQSTSPPAYVQAGTLLQLGSEGHPPGSATRALGFRSAIHSLSHEDS